MQPMLFIGRIEQWDRLQQGGGLPAATVVASADYDLTQTLRARGVDVVDLLMFATEEICRASLDQAWAVAEALRRNSPAESELGGCNLIERTANEIVFPWNEVFFQRALIDACLTRYHPPQVYGFQEMAQSYEWDFPAQQPADIFNATVAYCVAARGLPHMLLDMPARQSPHSASMSPSALPIPHAALRSRSQHTYQTLCFAPNFAALAEMRVLLQAVAKTRGADWLVVTDSDEALGPPILRQELLLSLPFDLSSASPGGDAAHQNALLASLDGTLNEDTKHLISDANFGFIWSQYFSRMAGWRRWHCAASFLEASTEASAIVMGYDILAPHRVIEAAFATRGVPSISIDHVGCGIDASHRRNIGGQAHVGVWGEADRLGQERWRGGPWLALEIGSLRRDHALLSEDRARSRNHQEGPKGPLPKTQSPRIVLFTSKFASSRTIGGSVEAFERSWKDLLALIAKRNDWHFVLKPHPSYDHHTFYQSAPFQLPNLEVITGLVKKNAQQILEQADVAILVNCASTTAIDAIGLGVPVVYLKDATWASATSPLENNLVICVMSTEELETVTARLISDAKYRDHVMRLSSQELSRLVVAAGQDAVDRTVRAIDQIRRPDSEREDRSELGSNILELLDSIGSPASFLRWAVRMRKLYPDAVDLDRETRRLHMAGAMALKAWLWSLVVERCRQTASRPRAAVFFSIAALLLPAPLRLNRHEIPAHWRLAIQRTY